MAYRDLVSVPSSRPLSPEIEVLVGGVVRGDRRALARAITLV